MRFLAHAALLGVIAAASASVVLSESARAAEPAMPAGAFLQSWHDNGHGGRYVLQVIQGRPLAKGERISGVVANDLDCAPDAEGLNHCHNEITLANGTRITVINTHEMMRNRCLGAGDRLSLVFMDTPWVVGTLESASAAAVH